MVLERVFIIKLKKILLHRYLLIIITILILIVDIIFINSYKYKSKYSINTKELTGVVTKYKQDKDKLTIYLKAKEEVIVNYYLQGNKKINISYGDKIKVYGKFNEPSNNTVPNTFNYKKYLYYNKIYYIMNANKIEKIKNNESVIYYIKSKILERINKIKKSGPYIKTFVLGDKSSLEDNVIDAYSNNGIYHLFSISGMHINLFSGFLLFLLKKISYNDKYNYFIVIIFLLFYIFIIDSSPSVLRTIVMVIIFAINKVFNLKIPKINLMAIILIIILCIDNLIIYNMGFQFSYLITFFLVIINTKKIKNKILKNIYISLISFLVSFPIVIYNFYQINILTIILNLIYVPIVSIIIFPLSIVTFIFPILDNTLYFLLNIMEKLSLCINGINYLQIIFKKPNHLFIIIYYLLLFLVIYKFKNIIYIILLLLLHKVSIYFNNHLLLSYIDVGQGDSILISLPYNKKNILIDTGGSFLSDYSIVENKIIPYLKSLGISQISYLILTHGDYDHMGEAINLVENFKVEKVIFNCGAYNDLEKELIKVLDKKKIPYYSCIKELNINNNRLYFLQTKEYDNENDNSNVIYTKLNGYKFLLMGDAGVEVEEDLIGKYNLENIDVLKVGHHGSKTSSGEMFIDEINPEYSIISVGKNNRYGHPNDSILDNLEESKIYRTDQDGSIMFKIKKNKLDIETCTP